MSIFQRKTRSQTVVQQVLECSPLPLTLQEVFTEAQKNLPRIAFSTVFRIMARLETEGLVHQITMRERGSRYEWAKRPHHHHVACDSCGSIVDIDDSTLAYSNAAVEEKTGYKITHHIIELSGVCAPCQRKA